jgi:hypothetical protein
MNSTNFYTAIKIARDLSHEHPTPVEAAKSPMPHRCAWYVIAVQGGAVRELTEEEERIMNEFRFGTPKRGESGTT